MRNNQSPMIELLAPAGDLEKLLVAFSYGADAVYCAGESFGLRSAAGNFSFQELEKGLSHAHKLGKKVYLTVNSFPNNDEIEQMADYLKTLTQFDLDALIISDAGVFALAKEITPFKIHISTQSSVTNVESVRFWYEQGASRVILAREVSLYEAHKIQEQCKAELEMFIHGSLCMSYSGKCVISNYTAHRDANRGGCVNSCRWEYSLCHSFGEAPFTSAYMMNSKDLCAVDFIPEMIDSRISSLKIEGRMKSHLYLANTVTAYRHIIDIYMQKNELSQEDKKRWLERLNSNPTRGFCSGFFESRAGKESVLYDNNKIAKKVVSKRHSSSNYIGIVKEVIDDYLVLQVKNRFHVHDVLGFLTFDGEEISYPVDEIKDLTRKTIDEAKPNNIVFLKKHSLVSAYTIVSLLEPSKE